MQWFSSSCKAQCNWLNTQTQKKGLNKSFAILSYSSFFGGGGLGINLSYNLCKEPTNSTHSIVAEIKPRPLWWRSCALTNPLQLYKLYINCIKFKYAFLDILDEETNLNCVSQGSCIPVFFF